MKLTKVELSIVEKVKAGIASDGNKSPWDSNKWYKGFTKDNVEGFGLNNAPLNIPLMVVTENVGTLYKNDRGQSLMRGSVLVKVSDNEVVSIDSQSWGATSIGAVTYENDGTFAFGAGGVYGKVKRVVDVIV